MLNEEDIFNARIERIKRDGNSLVESIGAVKEKVRHHEELTKDDLHILDILGFYERIELYLSPKKFKDVFNANYRQKDTDAISSIAASDEIQKRGGLATVYSETGIYTSDEIRAYLDELAETIEKSCSPEEPIGIVLGNMGHAIGLTYQPKAGWKFMDINQYPPCQFDCRQTQDIANKIMKGFRYRHPANNPYFSFNTSVLITGNNPNRLPLIEQLKMIKEKHVITKEIAQREERYNLASVAAYYGDADVITALAAVGADLGKKDSMGRTPAYAATEEGNADVIAALGEAGVDLNNDDTTHQTLAYVAAKQGDANVVMALAKAGVDLNKQSTGTADGQTPLYFAAWQGHVAVIAVLLKYKVNVNTPVIEHANTLLFYAPENCKDRMEAFINKQLDVGQDRNAISIKPYDIAFVMGHENVCTLLKSAAEVSSVGMFAHEHVKDEMQSGEKARNENDFGITKK
jgi:ankyrin repeat protein